MKKNIQILMFTIIVTIFTSCSNEEKQNKTDEDTIDNYMYNTCPTNKGLCCGINGRFKVIPGKKYLYSLTTTLNVSTVDWTVESGLITIVSTNGKNAYFKFNDNFSSGRVRVSSDGTDGQLCSIFLDISKL